MQPSYKDKEVTVYSIPMSIQTETHTHLRKLLGHLTRTNPGDPDSACYNCLECGQVKAVIKRNRFMVELEVLPSCGDKLCGGCMALLLQTKILEL